MSSFLQMLDEDVKIANWKTVEDGFDTWQEIPRDTKIYQLGGGIPVVAHQAAAEVSKIGRYRRGGLL